MPLSSGLQAPWLTNKSLGQAAPSTQFDLIAQELLGSDELVMRDVMQLCEMFERTRSHVVQYARTNVLDEIVHDALCPLVCYLQITHQGELENAIFRGEVSDNVCAYANSSKTLRRILDEAMSTSSVRSIPDPMENHSKIREEFLHD